MSIQDFLVSTYTYTVVYSGGALHVARATNQPRSKRKEWASTYTKYSTTHKRVEQRCKIIATSSSYICLPHVPWYTSMSWDISAVQIHYRCTIGPHIAGQSSTPILFGRDPAAGAKHNKNSKQRTWYIESHHIRTNTFGITPPRPNQ